MPGIGGGRALITPYATVPRRRRRFPPSLPRAGAGPRILDSVVVVMDTRDGLEKFQDCNLNASSVFLGIE